MMWTDTHCHLADDQFAPDRPAVLARARAAGVALLVEIAESPATWDAALALAEQDPLIYVSLGIHPHHAHEAGPAEWPSLREQLRRRLAHPKAVAVGEFGLDYFRMRNTRDQQDYLFRRQLELARELGKPVVVHCRDSHEDLQRVIAEFYPERPGAPADGLPNGVIHCFSGRWTDAQAYLRHGFLLGIDAPVTYPNARELQQNVERLPLERLVLETDAPYLPPQSHRGQRNEPSHIPAIAAAVAALTHRPLQDVAAQTTRNARALYRLAAA